MLQISAFPLPVRSNQLQLKVRVCLKIDYSPPQEKDLFVCICQAMDEESLKKLHKEGVNTLKKVIQHCGAGGDCGTCAFKINRILKDETNLQATEAEVEKISSASGE